MENGLLAIAPDSQHHEPSVAGGVPKSRTPVKQSGVTSLSQCLDDLGHQWSRKGSSAALWRDWSHIVGPQLALHCQPLSLHGKHLTVAAEHPYWCQMLQYGRAQLLADLQSAGFAISDLHIQRHHNTTGAALEREQEIWARHPSRYDVHGTGHCPACGSPAPAGEVTLWGHCGFCRRSVLSSQ